MTQDTAVMVQAEGQTHKQSMRCEYCGTEHKVEVTSEQKEGRIRITLHSEHGSLTMYYPQLIQ